MSIMRSIRLRFVFLVLLAAIPSFALAIHFSNEILKREISLDTAKNEQRFLQFASDQEKIFLNAKFVLKSLATEVRLEEDFPFCNTLADKLLSDSSEFLVIGAADLQGNVYCISPAQDAQINISEKKYFQAALRTKDFIIGSVDKPDDLGVEILPLTYPIIKNDGESGGVVFAWMDLDWLKSKIAETTAIDGIQFIVTDQDGLVIAAYPDSKRWIGKEMPLTSGAFRNGEMLDPVSDSDGVNRIYDVHYLGDNREITIFMGFPAISTFENTKSALFKNILLIGGVLFLILWITWFWGEGVFGKRASNILAASRRLALGDMNARTGVHEGDDELSLIAQTIDRMADAVQEHEEELCQEAALRQESMAALQVSEERHRLISEKMSDFVYSATINTEGQIQFEWSSGILERITGYSQDYLLGGGFSKIIHPDDKDEYWRNTNLLLTNEAVINEFRIRSSDGNYRWFREFIQPVYNDFEGRVSRILGAIQDITLQKMAEIELRHSNISLRTLSECNKILVRAKDEASLLQNIGQRIIEYGGYAQVWVGLIKSSDPDVLEQASEVGVYSDYYPLKDLRWKELESNNPVNQALITRKFSMVRNLQQESVGGLWRLHADECGLDTLIVLPLIGNDKALGVLVIGSDYPDAFDAMSISLLEELAEDLGYGIQSLRTREEQIKAKDDLYQSEQMLRLVLDNIPQRVYWKGQDLRFKGCNHSFVADVGFDDPEQLVGKVDGDLPWVLEGHQHQTDDERILRIGEEVIGREEKIEFGQGKEKWIRSNKVPFRDQEGGIIGVLGTYEDISKQKQAEILERAVYMVSEAANQADDLEALYRLIHEVLSRLMPAENFYLALYNDKNQTISFQYEVDQMDEPIGPKEIPLVEFGRSLTTYVLETGQTLMLADVDFAAFLEREGLQQVGTLPKSWLGVPLKSGERIIGVFVIQNYNDGVQLGNKERQILEFVSSQVAMAIERKRASKLLRESEKRFRSYFELPLIGIAITSPEMRWLEVNDRLCEILGYTRSELINLSWEDLLSDHSLIGIVPSVTTVRSNGDRPYIEKGFIRKGGGTIFAQVSAEMVVDSTGKPDYVVVLIQDITERKQREYELEVISSISSSLRKAQTHREMMPMILNQLILKLQVQNAAIALVDKISGDYLIESMQGGWSTTNQAVIPKKQGITGYACSTGQVYVTENIQNDPLNYSIDGLEENMPGLCAPLLLQDHVLGALWVARKKQFEDSDIRLIKSVADITASALHRSSLHEQTEKQLEHLNALHAIDVAISQSHDMQSTLLVVLGRVISELSVDAADILLINPINKLLTYKAGLGFRTYFVEQSRVKLGEGLAGKVAGERRLVSVTDVNKMNEKFTRRVLLESEEFSSYHGVPLLVKGEVKGVLEVYTRSVKNVDAEWLDFLDVLAGQAAIAVDNAMMFEDLQRSNAHMVRAYDATIEGWSRALELRDQETQGHSQRVTELTVKLARECGVPEAEIPDIRRGALLHDIGKMGVPDHIILKPGPLTDEEWKIMRKHPTYAYQMLSPIEFLWPAIDIPYCHHERWDGKGYPRGLKGVKIPLPARIFAVIDVWDALTSDRPYRLAWSVEETIAYIKEESGKQFDPDVVDVFLNFAVKARI